MRTDAFAPEDISDIVAFWNRAFFTYRLFVPLTEESFRSRIMSRTAFRPEALRIAREGDHIVGLGHAARKGSEGFLSFLYVAPHARRQGIGTRLLEELDEWWGDMPEVRAGAVVFDPVYGVDFDDKRTWGGPRMPFYGSSEGVAPTGGDLETRNFMVKRGFTPIDPDYSMLVEGLRSRNEDQLNRREEFSINRREYRITIVENSSVRQKNYRWEVPHRCVQLLSGGRGLGECTWFAFDSDLAIIYDFYLEPEARSKGLGKAVLLRALADMKDASVDRCDLTTGSRRNARAVEIYRKAGFRIAEVWQPYVRREA
jgi:GNAT superfamily N-acetyltransferase